MAWAGIVPSSRAGKGMTVAEYRNYVSNLIFREWRPSFGVLHNTGAPTLAQWNSYPEAQRILNLERYYRDEQGWQSAPHAFVDNDTIWPFTPLTMKGTHSPSFNGFSFGIELVGDYDTEEDDRGPGFDAKMNTVAVFAIIFEKLGIEPSDRTIRLHKEDPRTTHNCPGRDIDKSEFVRLVSEYMNHGGAHARPADAERVLAADYQPRKVEQPPEGATTDRLNLRESSSASSRVVTVLPVWHRLAVLGEAMNGATRWLRVWTRVSGAEQVGWVAARYVKMD